MSDNINIAVQKSDFDVGAQLDAMRRANSQIGAIASFVGVVRDINEGDEVATLELEHYPGMTERSIRDIAVQACERWQLQGVCVIHRIGKLAPTDQIVFVAVSGMHRREAFEACEFIMDYLKTRAPFWKKELTPNGERWVEARCTDQSAADRWKTEAN